MMKLRELPQKMQVMLAPGDNIVKIVAARDGGTDHQQQDLRERIDDAPRLTVIRQCGKMVQQQGQTRTGTFPLKNRVHDRDPMRIRAPMESHRGVNSKLTRQSR
jgi:hypothetical protein